MRCLDQKVLPLLVCLLFTSPASSSKVLDDVGEEKELLKEPTDSLWMPLKLKQPLDEAKDYSEEHLQYVKQPLDEAKDYSEEHLQYVKQPLDEAEDYSEEHIQYVKQPLDETEEGIKKPLMKSKNSEEQHLTENYYREDEQGTPIEQVIEFLQRVGISIDRDTSSTSHLNSKGKGGRVEILNEKTKSDKFSKKGLERSINFDMSSFIIDICDGDISDMELEKIADALKRASIDITGKEHEFVNEIMKFIYFYESIVHNQPADVESYGGSADGQLFIWSPYRRALRFLKRVFRYLLNSGFFKEEDIAHAEKDMIYILKEKFVAGKRSKKLFETTTNFDMAGFLIGICYGDVSDQQLDVIASALTRASKDTIGKEHSSVKEIMEIIRFYKENAIDWAGDDLLHPGSAARTDMEKVETAGQKEKKTPAPQLWDPDATGANIPDLTASPSECAVDDEAFHMIWQDILDAMNPKEAVPYAWA